MGPKQQPAAATTTAAKATARTQIAAASAAAGVKKGSASAKASAAPAVTKINLGKAAGLCIPCNRVKHIFKKRTGGRNVSKQALVYMTGVLDYLALETLELAGNLALHQKCKRITPDHLAKVLRRDDMLCQLVPNADFFNTSVEVHIHEQLLGKAAQKRLRENREAAKK